MGNGRNAPNGGKLEIVFISSSDPFDVRAFSGTPFFMVKALQAEFPEMEILRRTRPRWFDKSQRQIQRLSRDTINPYYWKWLNRLFARALARRWRGRRVLVISVVNATLVAELARLLPVVNITDATFELMRGFYQKFSALADAGAVRAEEDERGSIVHSVHNSFCSRWAARSAIDHYGARAEDVSVISWGINIPDVSASEIGTVEADGPCRLLFLGGDWLRKGGDVAVEAARILTERGIECQLDIAGPGPIAGLEERPYIHVHGFLSKADPAQLARLQDLVRNAGFLFLPTRQESWGMVFGEANAYGTPAVSRDTGGVGDVIEDGVNGLLLPNAATAEDFADAIQRAWSDRAGYARLRQSSRRTYETRLNWPVWAKAMRGIVERLEEDKRI